MRHDQSALGLKLIPILHENHATLYREISYATVGKGECLAGTAEAEAGLASWDRCQYISRTVRRQFLRVRELFLPRSTRQGHLILSWEGEASTNPIRRSLALPSLNSKLPDR